MFSPQYEPRRLYNLHVFKDNGSNWTNPTVTVFPISSHSARKFGARSGPGRYVRSGPKGYPGNRDGLVNLYRLPSDQLSFLQQYVGKLNAEVEEKKAEAMKDLKASIKQQEKEKFDREMKRNEAKIKLLELERQNLKERKKDGDNSADKQNQGEVGTKDNDTITRGRRPRSYRYDSDSDDTAREGPRYRHRYPQPPPPPPRIRGSASNPVVYETHWTIEEVELTFIPETVSLVSPILPFPRPMALQTFKIAEPGEQPLSRKEVRLEVATNAIAPESFSSFAVVLSRSRGVEIPCEMGGYREEYSPVRSYISDVASQYDEAEECAETVENVDYFPSYPPAPFWAQPSVIPDPTKVPEEEEGVNAPNESEKDEDAIETESKTGEEGEDCGEGAVYINVVKKEE